MNTCGMTGCYMSMPHAHTSVPATGANVPSCTRRHVCPDTDQRVLDAAHDYARAWAGRWDETPDILSARARLMAAVEAQSPEDSPDAT
jgi:hypothetical protein